MNGTGSVDLGAETVALFERLRLDPGGFLEIVLGLRLRAWQAQACEEIAARLQRGERHPRVTVRSCHGAGKTTLGAGLTLWWTSTRADSRVLTLAQTWAGVERLVWPEIARLWRGSKLLQGLRFGEMLSTEFRISDAWYACGASSDRPERLEGHHSPTAAMRLIDEAKAVDPAVFDATEGLLDAPQTLDVWISTPSLRSGRFYEREARGPEDVIRLVVTVDDLIADGVEGKLEWKARRLEEWGELSPEFKSRAMAEYIDEAEGAMFPYGWIEKAMAESFEVLGQPVAGLDVAGSKDGDESVVALAYGPDEAGRYSVRIPASWRERDTMLSKGRALALAREASASLVRVDAVGLGKGVSDALAADFRVEEYRSNSKASDPSRFAGRKAEDLWRIRGLLEKGLLRLPVSQTLKAQLLGMRYRIDPQGRVRVEDPTDSPDHVDAMTIALAVGVWDGPFVMVGPPGMYAGGPLHPLELSEDDHEWP